MKLIKGLGLLSFLVIFSGSCFEPPEFPVVPQIEFEDLQFIDSPDPSQFDSLILYLNFKDGDGDLGFREEPAYVSAPFHNADFYQENNGNLQPLTTSRGYVGQDEYDLLDIPDPALGKLVVFRTRLKPAYTSLPQTFDCSVYEYLAGPSDPTNSTDGRRLLIAKSDLAALDPQTKVVDSIPDQEGNIAYYQIQDTLYYTPNPDHYNIEVDFLVKDPSAPGGFSEFDWQQEFCTTFDGRFPVFSDKESSVDGTLRYSMTSLGFTTLFSIKTLKLRVSIKDLARNKSNVIETPEFTLH